MAKVAVTDGLSAEAKVLLEKNGHEVVVKFYENDELELGVLNDFDALIVLVLPINVLFSSIRK